MHPRIDEVLTYLATQRAMLERAVATVPSSLRTRRPGPERWSVAEVLAHLVIVEGRVTQLLGAQIGAARAAGLGRERETSAVVPTVNIARVLDRSRPVTAGAASQPPPDANADIALAALVERHDALRATLAGADGLALGEVSAPNPVLGPINVYQWVVFIGAHEARHAAQIQEIAGALAGSEAQ
jgi:hypothetical protein